MLPSTQSSSVSEFPNLRGLPAKARTLIGIAFFCGCNAKKGCLLGSAEFHFWEDETKKETYDKEGIVPVTPTLPRAFCNNDDLHVMGDDTIGGAQNGPVLVPR